jgi:hypothetical protein
MNLRSVVAVASTLLLFGGCAPVENRTGAEKFIYSQSDKEMAVVILSVGAADMCISFVTRLKLLPAESPYSGRTVAYLPVDSYVVKSEYSDHHGYLHVVRLKPGSYYFTPHINNPAVGVTRAFRADFTVSGGEVVYLGNYYLHQSCGLSSSGSFSDQWERDLALLKSKNPPLSQAPIQKRILRVTGQIRF